MAYSPGTNISTGKAPTSYNASGSSTEMLAADTDRTGLWITNISNQTVYVAFGSNAAVVGTGVRIIKNETIQMGSDMLCQEAVNVITAGGSSKTLSIQEWD